MKIVSNILQKVLVNHFYKVNAGIFIFLFFALFGLPQQPYYFHTALIHGILESQSFLVFVMFVWLLYGLKCIVFIVNQLNDQKLSFLHCLNNLNRRKRVLCLLYVQVLICMPILLYAGAILLIGIKQGKWIYVFEIVVFNIVLICLSAFTYLIVLERKTLLPRIPIPSIVIRYDKPFFLFSLLHLWHTQKQMLLVTKSFSLLILWIFMHTYEPVGYDIRPLMLCVLLSIISHSAIVVQLKIFDDEGLSFTKNLPISIPNRFLALATTVSVLLIPEFVFVWKGYGVHFSWPDFPQIVLFPISLVCFFYTVLFFKATTVKQSVPVVFGISTACFFILLYNPGIVLALVICILSYVLYSSYYYHVERKAADSNA